MTTLPRLRRTCLLLFAAIALMATALPASAQTTFTIQAGHSGSWYDLAQSGHGVTVEVLTDGRVLIWWFTFDGDGNRIWIGGSGEIDGDQVVIEAIVVEGGAFPPDFDPNNITVVVWGTITLVFHDCDSATLSWVPDLAGFTEGSMPLVRLTRLAGLADQCTPPAISADLTIPVTDVVVGTNYTLDPGEWDDAVSVTIEIAPNWVVTAHLQSDGENLAFAFENLGGPGGINRPPDQAQPNTLFPELFFDLAPDGRSTFTDDNYWFHVSFQDCSFRRLYNLVINCDNQQPGWVANNWPLTASNVVEIVVSYELLGLEPGQAHLVGLSLVMTSALVGNPVYHLWPESALESDPASWPQVLIAAP